MEITKLDAFCSRFQSAIDDLSFVFDIIQNGDTISWHIYEFQELKYEHFEKKTAFIFRHEMLVWVQVVLDNQFRYFAFKSNYQALCCIQNKSINIVICQMRYWSSDYFIRRETTFHLPLQVMAIPVQSLLTRGSEPRCLRGDCNAWGQWALLGYSLLVCVRTSVAGISIVVREICSMRRQQIGVIHASSPDE